MRDNDNLVIQIAIAMIIIAILGVTMIRASRYQSTTQDGTTDTQPVVVKVQQGTSSADARTNDTTVELNNAQNKIPSINTLPRLVENINSDQANLVKQYFAALEGRDFTTACDVVSNDKCRATNPTSVELFSREYNKFINGYEYVSVKDLGFKSPSGKDVVCAKYSYRYKDDADPELVSEIMSFYVSTESGEMKITDRVCEKKYKEGYGVRPCPIEPNARYCIGNVK